jgi:hypothetical protein
MSEWLKKVRKQDKLWSMDGNDRCRRAPPNWSRVYEVKISN